MRAATASAPGLQRGSRALAQRASRRVDIVDEEDAWPADPLRARYA
ncbi:MAG: hypothetical protein MZU91_04605 [Desulfosudis oleivorans]|nr:hypothetical protein [Desulfosudis oleivorans]